MNAERLLGYFETISEAPDAIARLRRFILDLAVRGKLVEQDPEDEPAEEQLERITLAKLTLGRKERSFNKKKPNASIESFQFHLPTGWATATLADLVSILNGRAYKQAELLDSGTPVLRVGNLFTSNKWYYSNLELAEDKYCDDGDLIFAWSASFGPFVWRGGRVIYHYHIWKLPLHSPGDLSRDYLYLYLLHKTAEIKLAGHGISMVHMTKEKMELLEVPLPPLAEQHRIVAKVDELMALCDQLEAARHQREQGRERLVAATLQRLNQPAEDPVSFRRDARFAMQVLPSLASTAAQIKQLRQTILNLAVRGKLVEHESNDDDCNRLIADLKAEQLHAFRSGSIKPKVVALSAVSCVDASGEMSSSRVFNLANLVVVGPQNGVSPPEVTDISAPKALTLSATTSGFFNAKCYKHVNIAPEACEPYWLSSGDLLFQGGNTREYVGIAAVYEGPNRSFIFPDLMIRVRISTRVFLKYVHMALLSPDARSYLTRNASGSSETMPKINQDVLLSTPIPLPPLAEQHRIVAKVDTLMALCDELEQQLNQADQQRRRLLETVLVEALREPERALAALPS